MVPEDADSDAYIGRRIRVRDLRTLLVVAEQGSMAKAASKLAMTQPAVSQAMADLEGALGVRLFERSTQGATLTEYGRIVAAAAIQSLDALKQGLRRLRYMADAGAGDVWVGCAEAAMHGFLPAVIERLAREHPRIIVHAFDVNPADNDFRRLRERTLDLVIGRSPAASVPDDLMVETLFEERFAVVTGSENAWARRRKLALSDLVDETWIVGEPSNSTQALISEVFARKGLPHPKAAVYTTSMSLRLGLLASGKYMSCIPLSTFRFGSRGRNLKVLPLDLGLTLPTSVYTLKHRSLAGAAETFLATVRATAAKMADVC